MPQLELSTYPSQIFWLFLAFGALVLFLKFFYIPKILKIKTSRDKIALESVEISKNLSNEYKEVQKSMFSVLFKAKEEAAKKRSAAVVEAKKRIEQSNSAAEAQFHKDFKLEHSRIVAAGNQLKQDIGSIYEPLAEDIYNAIINSSADKTKN